MFTFSDKSSQWPATPMQEYPNNNTPQVINGSIVVHLFKHPFS